MCCSVTTKLDKDMCSMHGSHVPGVWCTLWSSRGVREQFPFLALLRLYSMNCFGFFFHLVFCMRFTQPLVTTNSHAALYDALALALVFQVHVGKVHSHLNCVFALQWSRCSTQLQISNLFYFVSAVAVVRLKHSDFYVIALKIYSSMHCLSPSAFVRSD